MIILDKPFISDETKDYLDSSHNVVLENEISLSENQGHQLNILGKDEFLRAFQSGDRLYTVSENSIDWIYQNIPDEKLISCINRMKDKVKFRELLKDLFPNFFYKEVSASELNTLDFKSLTLPFVLKPSVGFFSVGVYTITCEEDWKNAINDIFATMQERGNAYPDNVVGNSTFILEQYIPGDEYAIDAYYDENGQAVILNIMKHDFSSISDVSDRLYYTGKEILESKLQIFTNFLNEVNKRIQAVNFPLHAEVRINRGSIIPIEFNPMRFAGWCCTDLVYFAFGFKTYDYYFNNVKPDWDGLLKGKENKLYSLIVLDKPASFEPGDSFAFDRLCARFKKVLKLRKLDYQKQPVFGFLFTETEVAEYGELEYIIKADMKEFVLKGEKQMGKH